MTVQRQAKIPNPLRQPLVVLESVSDIRELLVLAKKESIEQGREQTDRMKFIRIGVFLTELEKNASARVGNQLDEHK